MLFFTTENLWKQQFDKINNLKIVMISESPLFGDFQNYIYNPNTPPGVFFHFKDLEVFLDIGQTIEKPKTIIEQKKTMFDLFYKNGFLVLDIFPFALNPNHTKLHYRKMSKKLYHQLLKITTKNYLIPKLNLCLDKANRNTYFVYRYKRLFDKTENHFEEVLSQISLKGVKYKVDTINGANMSLDRSKLKKLLKL